MKYININESGAKYSIKDSDQNPYPIKLNLSKKI